MIWKKVFIFERFLKKTERWILEIKDGKSMLIELIDDKKTVGKYFIIYSGDVVRKKAYCLYKSGFKRSAKMSFLSPIFTHYLPKRYMVSDRCK